MASYECVTETPTAANTVEGTSTPSASQDGTSRIVWSTDDVGRGVSVSIRPLEATGQFVCHRVELSLVQSNAGPEDA